jgi:hypothetical protein
MKRIGRDLLDASKAAAATSDGDKGSTRSRDLLSLLVRANTAVDLPDSQRLSDADVVARTYFLYCLFMCFLTHYTFCDP